MWAGVSVLLPPAHWPEIHPTRGPALLTLHSGQRASESPCPQPLQLPWLPLHLHTLYSMRLEVAGGVLPLSLQHMTGCHVGGLVLYAGRTWEVGSAQRRGSLCGWSMAAWALLTSPQGLRPVQRCQPQKHQLPPQGRGEVPGPAEKTVGAVCGTRVGVGCLPDGLGAQSRFPPTGWNVSEPSRKSTGRAGWALASPRTPWTQARSQVSVGGASRAPEY